MPGTGGSVSSEHESDRSVTRWISELKAGNDAALQELWALYFDRIVQLARKKLRHTPRRAMDEEDIAQNVMKSLWAGAVHGRFPLLHDRDNLWGLLIVLTTRKAADEKARSRRQKRGGGRVRGESAFDGNPATASDPGLGMILSEQPSPATLVELEDSLQQLLGRLDDETLRTIALWRMQGYTRDEIADQLGCARRTVARKLELIRKKWIAAD